MRKRTYEFIADPGHGWLKVSLKEFEKAIKDCDDDFGCSYISSNFKNVFLEEDCDASKFLKLSGHLKDDGKLKDHISMKIRYTKGYARLRGYQRYSYYVAWRNEMLNKIKEIVN